VSFSLIEPDLFQFAQREPRSPFRPFRTISV
jgi:hypothetical protein